MPTTLYYCPGCGEFVAGGEPCECMFIKRGTIDANGVLHTAARVPSHDAHVCDDEPAEFSFGEFDDGAHWREPAALPEPSHQDWLTEPGGDPEDWIVIEEPTGEDSESAHLALSSPYTSTYW